jgi:hypothetical protein
VASKISSLLAALMLLGCESSGASSHCETIESIAADAKKMRYAKEWLTKRLADPEFLKSIQVRSTFEYADERTKR